MTEQENLKKIPSIFELFTALQFKHVCSEADFFLETDEGKRWAVAVLLAYDRLKWMLLPDKISNNSPINKINKLPQGSVLTIKLGSDSMKVVLLEESIIDDTTVTILQVSPISEKKESATNYDIVITNKYLPFETNKDQMICTWLDFPVLSSSIHEYHGVVSPIARILMRRLADQHIQQETLTVEGGIPMRPHTHFGHIQHYSIQQNNINFGYSISTFITQPDDPRIEFQNNLIAKTNIFVEKVRDYSNKAMQIPKEKGDSFQYIGEVIVELNKNDMDNIKRAIEKQHGHLQNDSKETSVEPYPNIHKILDFNNIRLSFGINKKLNPYLSIIPLQIKESKNVINSICLVNERGNSIIFRKNVSIRKKSKNIELFLPLDFLTTESILEFIVNNQLYIANLKFKH